MADTRNLYVPVTVDALVINNSANSQDQSTETKAQWKNLTLNMECFNTPDYYTDGIESDPSDELTSNSIYPDGIYLKWTLPSSLRHGTHDPVNNALQFPLVPNRWLIVRTDDLQNAYAWIVESDTDSGDQYASCWLDQEIAGGALQKISLKRIGNRNSLNGWTEPAQGKPLFLTAVAPGNPDFSASYKHCANVFGMCDDTLQSGSSGTYSYKVFGWYSDAEANPLRYLDSTGKEVAGSADFLQRLKELSWSLDGTDTGFDDTDFPNDIICHGAVNSVSWNTNIPSQVPACGPVAVGIGNTSSEALAALLNNRVNGADLTKPYKLLSAFQLKLMQDYGLRDDGFELMQKKIHSGGFTPVKGGSCWVLEKAEKDPGTPGSDFGNADAKPFNSEISKQLQYLNDLQTKYDALKDNIRDRQAQMYALNFKVAYGRANSEDVTQPPYSNISEEMTQPPYSSIKDDINVLNSLKQKNSSASDNWPDDWTGQIVTLFNTLHSALADPANGMLDYVIKEVPLPVYYQPAEPAIVVDGISPSPLSAGKGSSSSSPSVNDGSLQCRTINALVANIVMTANKSSIAGDKINVNWEQKPDLTAFPARLQEIFQEIFTESLLLDTLNASCIANLINNNETVVVIQGNDLQSDVDVFIGLKTGQPGVIQFLTKGNASSQTPAIAPAVGSIYEWPGQPWRPVYLEWSINWQNTYNSFADNGPLQNWQLVKSTNNTFNNVDYAPDASLVALQGEPYAYTGRTILSDNLAKKLSDINGALGNIFQVTTPMSQTLSGFNSQMLQRLHTIQLPVLKDDNTPDEIMSSIGDGYTWRPMVDISNFLPVRTGIFNIDTLRVIDAFGQGLNIISPDLANNIVPVVSSNLLNDGTGQITLPPRLAQPARLLFNWLSAADPSSITNSDPASTPVRGWLLHNILDKSLTVFDAGGNELLEIRDTMLSDASPLQVPDSVLRQVVTFAISSEANFLELLSQVDAANKKAQPKPSMSGLTMSLPSGFPIAVASAQLTLQLKGIAAENQYVATDPNTDSPPDPGVFTDLNFTVCVGNGGSKQDGVIAYFDPGTPSAATLPFKADLSINTNNTDWNVGTFPQLQFNKPLNLTLLLDPRLSVNISSGILPEANYQLPDHSTIGPLKAISQRFLVAPLLTPATSVIAPLLQSSDLAWSWIASDKSVVTPVNQTLGDLKFDQLHAVEGWLKITKKS